jgi:hypothetical protein
VEHLKEELNMTVAQFTKQCLAMAALVLGALVGVESSASADLNQCATVNGSVRVFDIERNACGRLTVNNSDWRNIGNPPWNDRIDQFGNDDWSRGRSMCLYRDISYLGTVVTLRPGYTVTWRNIVSSNRWC